MRELEEIKEDLDEIKTSYAIDEANYNTAIDELEELTDLTDLDEAEILADKLNNKIEKLDEMQDAMIKKLKESLAEYKGN